MTPLSTYAGRGVRASPLRVSKGRALCPALAAFGIASSVPIAPAGAHLDVPEDVVALFQLEYRHVCRASRFQGTEIGPAHRHGWT